VHTVVVNEDITHRRGFLEKIPVNGCNLTKVIRDVSENIPLCVVEAHLKSPHSWS
jgi:hypothetical protein